MIALILAGLLAIAVWQTLRGKSSHRLVSATATALVVLTILTLLFEPALIQGAVGPARLVINPRNIASGSLAMSIAAAGLLTASILHTTVPNMNETLSSGGHPTRRLIRSKKSNLTLAQLTPYILFASTAGTALWIVGRGLRSLLTRNVYIPEPAVPALVQATGPVLPVVFAVSLLLWRTSRTWPALVLATIVALCVLASASRLLALLPVISMVTTVAANQHHLARFKIIGNLLVSLLLLILVLHLRELPYGNHGLIPYLSAAIQPSSYSATIQQTLFNLLFAVPLAGATIASGRFTFQDLLVSVSPVGTSEEWSNIAPTLRIHYFIPYSSVGELATLSFAYLFLFFVALGALIASTASVAQRLDDSALTAVSAVSILMFALLLQYNLRSGFRVILLVAVANLTIRYLLQRKTQNA